MSAALEATETGKQVVLVEKRPYLGGRVTQLYKYFPKLCFPTCGLEINQRRAKMNPNLTVLTMAEFSEKPRILALACENDAYPALDMAAQGPPVPATRWSSPPAPYAR